MVPRPCGPIAFSLDKHNNQKLRCQYIQRKKFQNRNCFQQRFAGTKANATFVRCAPLSRCRLQVSLGTLEWATDGRVKTDR